MKCKLIYLVFLVFSLFPKFAVSDNEPLFEPDEITQKISEIKKFMHGKEWVPTDSAAYNRLALLLTYIENPSIDTVMMQLQNDLNSDMPLFMKSSAKVKNPTAIKGYIPSGTIAHQLEVIEHNIRVQNPDSNIKVPEEIFIGMYSRLPLVSKVNTEQLYEEKLVNIPDEILIQIYESKQSRNQRQREAVEQYLDSIRVVYNNKLIQEYRDLKIKEYRNEYVGRLIENAQAAYTDSVSKINYKLLKVYNDSVQTGTNQHIADLVSDLLFYAGQITNPLTIYNLKNDSTTMQLQNYSSDFRWIWLKNFHNDSIGIKIENINKNTIRILVDESLNLSRLDQKTSQTVSKVEATHQMKMQLTKIKTVNPQLRPWSNGGKAYSGFSQTYINDYWAKGGNSSASVLTTLNYFINYTKPKVKWENSADVKLGLVFNFYDEEISMVRNYQKNSDNLDITSKLGVSAFKKWYYSTELDFKTQTFPGFRNQLDTIMRSSLFSPAYLNFSIGLDYKPNKDLSVFLSPISLKTTFVTNPNIDPTTYGLDKEQSRKSRIGLYGKMEHKRKLLEDISLQTKNSMFVNFGRDKEGEALWYKIPDIDSETTINFKVNHFISTQLNAQFIYNKDVVSKWKEGEETKSGTRLQMKEFFTLGISYKF